MKSATLCLIYGVGSSTGASIRPPLSASATQHSSIRVHPLPSYVLGNDAHKSGGRTRKGLPSEAPECVVGKSGTLREIKNSEVINKLFDAQVTVTAHDISVSSPNTNSTFPIWKLRIPLVTWPESQSCFTMQVVSPSKSHTLCASSPHERNAWVTALYKAVYCISGARSAPVWFNDEGEVAPVPAKSTKDGRWQGYLKSLLIEPAAAGPPSGSSTTSSSTAAPAADGASSAAGTPKPKHVIEIVDLDQGGASPDVVMDGVGVI